MLSYTLDDICAAIRADAPGSTPGERITGVSTDSRAIRDGDVFFALRGASFDGHDFVDEALARGAVAAVVARDWNPDTDLSRILRVDDTGDALCDLARSWRGRCKGTFVGITGSNGKTSTKEVLASIGAQAFRTHKAPASFNNRIGLPLTLLEMDADVELAVLEMGTNHFGEIEELCHIADPGIGVITTVTEAHLEGLVDLDGVIRAKGELAQHIRRRRGILVINQDDPGCRELVARFGGEVITYGIEEEADVRGLEVKEGRRGTSFFVRDIGWFRAEQGGLPSVYSALAAVAVGQHLGIEPQALREGVRVATPPPMRMEKQTIDGVTVVNDAYNANPQSSRAALDSLTRMAGTGRRLFVLGDMLELGKRSKELHEQFGRDVAASGITAFWTLGPKARWAAEGARRGGMNARQVFAFQSVECLGQALGVYLQAGDTVLLKASRGMHLEEVAAGVKTLLQSGTSGRAMGRAG